MALPAIPPYPMPEASSLPANRVAWTVDPDRALLLVHDLQNHFLAPFEADAPPVNELLTHVAAVRGACRRAGVPVVYSAQPGGQSSAERGLQQDFWGPGVPAGPWAEAIAEPVAPGPDDTVLTKWKYSAFVRTDLAELMRARGRDQLVVVGVYAHIGVLATACDAWMRDIPAFVVADAVADFSAGHHRTALEWAAGRCAAVTTTDAVCAALGAAAAPGAREAAWTVQRLREEVAEVLGEDPAELRPDENLADYGLDSVRLMALVERWRRDGAEVAFADLAGRPTLREWARVLADTG